MDDTAGCILGLVLYVYVSLCLFVLAQKTGADNAWFAFVPILDLILLLSIADKPIWWIVGFLIPLVNIAVAALVWMGVATARGKPVWLGLLILVPGVNLIVIGYLAFSS
jgi:hypothetical protein